MRLSNWEPLLQEFLAERRSAPFAYGKNDCAMFVSDAVLAMTGIDPAADFRGKYRTKAGSIRVLRKIGDGDLVSTFAARFSEKPVSFALRGDIVFDGEAVGICVGSQAAFVGVHENCEGLFLSPMSEMQRAFAV